MTNLYTLIDADIKNRLSDKRYRHSVCVSQACGRLADKYGYDRDKAILSGIGHDVLKELPEEETLALFKDNRIELTPIELAAPKLWHAIAGAVYLKKMYGIEDEIVSAVRYHTTGKTGMTLLQKILYIADFISEDRDYDGVEEMRRRADISLENAMYEGLRFTVYELSEKGRPIHPDTFEAYNEIMLEFINNE